jgi:hypothetical protein
MVPGAMNSVNRMNLGRTLSFCVKKTNHYAAKTYEVRHSAKTNVDLLLLSVRLGAMTTLFFLPTSRRLILELPT